MSQKIPYLFIRSPVVFGTVVHIFFYKVMGFLYHGIKSDCFRTSSLAMTNAGSVIASVAKQSDTSVILSAAKNLSEILRARPQDDCLAVRLQSPFRACLEIASVETTSQ